MTQIPKLFEDYIGYNKIKRKEIKGHVAIILRFVTFACTSPIFPADEALREAN